METKFSGEQAIMQLAKAENRVVAFRRAYLHASRKGRAVIVGIINDQFWPLVTELAREGNGAIRVLHDQRIIWKGGIVLVPFLVTDRAWRELPDSNTLVFLNDKGEIIYSL